VLYISFFQLQVVLCPMIMLFKSRSSSKLVKIKMKPMLSMMMLQILKLYSLPLNPKIQLMMSKKLQFIDHY